jgi:SIT4-associating protein SAP185/190
MPLLLAYLGQDSPSFTQTSAGDFIKAIITISANASQNEQSCIGPNSLTRQLVSATCIEKLIADMLRGGNALTVGVGIIIEVIRKNNSDYDPEVGSGQDSLPSSNDPIYLGTLLRLFATHVPDFTKLILSPNHTVISGDTTVTVKRKALDVAFGGSIEPLGFDRFKTCELMAELLHCSNMGLLNERGSEAHVKQRDQEREILKAEGALVKTSEPRSAVTEFSEDSNGFNHDSIGLGFDGPGEGARRLEIANNAEDDGFEDVGTSGVLTDDVKDDFDERSFPERESHPTESVQALRPSKSRLSLDDEFYDEPLTSPRLQAVQKEDGIAEAPETLLSQTEATSPRLTLSSDVTHLQIEKDPKAQNMPATAEGKTPTDQLLDEIVSQLPSQRSTLAAPQLPHRDHNLNAETYSHEPTSSRGLSPHPDDKPAPLFATRPEEPVNRPVEIFQSPLPIQEAFPTQETIAATQGEEMDTAMSMQTNDDEQSFAPYIETDIDGQPVVGDYLKMMFVEHRVVPTILVSCSSMHEADT